MGGLLPLAHGGTLYQDIEPNIERAGVAVPHRVQIRQGRRGAFGPRERNAKRSQRLQRHDPRRNRRREILCQERPQRLVFPSLQIARRPVIEQAQAKDMRLGIRHRNRQPARIARTDEDAEFEFIVQAIARSYRGLQGAGGKPLPMRPGESLARDTDGRTAAMVADRYPAVIRQQRIVRPHQPADGRRVMNRRVEIGVVADLRRQRILRVALRHQTAAQRCLQRRSLAQPVEQRAAHGAANRRPKLHQRIERGLRAGADSLRRLPIENRKSGERREIDDLIPDRHAAAKLLRGIGAAEHCEGQVLNGEIAADPVGRIEPAARPRIMRLVE